jgi:Zinc finger, C2H2 type
VFSPFAPCSDCASRTVLYSFDRLTSLWIHCVHYMSLVTLSRTISAPYRLRPHQCSVCAVSFAKGSDLRRHASAVHSVPIEEPLYTCPECLTGFRRESQLKLHRRFVHEGDSSLIECYEVGCDGIFATRQGLRKHLAIKDGSKQLVCIPRRPQYADD